ncbi:MAG: DUF2608 domain-containing protein, partial [Proteobacteria bacterium]
MPNLFQSACLSLVLISSLAHTAQADIQEIKSYTDPLVKSELAKRGGEETWVIYDIDNTLLHPLTMVGSHQWGDHLRDQRLALGDSKETAEDFQHASFSAVQSQVPVALTEEAALATIELFKRKKSPQFALTARHSEIIDETLNQTLRLGINFENTFPELSGGDHSIHRGVVFSGETPKGVLLKRLIAMSKVKPKKIIFFDDRRYNLESVEKELKSEAIEFMGLRYAHQDKEVSAFRA